MQISRPVKARKKLGNADYPKRWPCCTRTCDRSQLRRENARLSLLSRFLLQKFDRVRKEKTVEIR